MKKYLFILFFLPLSLWATSKYNYFEVSYNLNRHIYLNNNEIALVGNRNSFMVHNLEESSFKEYYSSNSSSILDIAKKNGFIYSINKQGILNIYREDIYSPVFFHKININNISFISYVSDSSVFVVNFEGRVFEYLWKKEELLERNEFNIGIQAQKFSHWDKHIIIQNKNIYQHNNSGMVKVFELPDLMIDLENLYSDENFLYLQAKSETYKFDYNFNLIEHFEYQSKNGFLIGENRISVNYAFDTALDEMKDTLNFEMYSLRDEEIILSTSYPIDHSLKIFRINSIYDYDDKIYYIGNTKSVLSTNRNIINFKILSSFNDDSFFSNGFGFHNDSLGYYAANNSLFFITTDGGVSWRPIDKFKDPVLYKIKEQMRGGFFLNDGTLILDPGIRSLPVMHNLVISDFETLDYYNDSLILAGKSSTVDYYETNDYLISFARGSLIGDGIYISLVAKNELSNKKIVHIEKRRSVNTVKISDNRFLIFNTIPHNSSFKEYFLSTFDTKTLEFEDMKGKILDSLTLFGGNLIKHKDNLFFSGTYSFDSDTSFITYKSNINDYKEYWEKIDTTYRTFIPNNMDLLIINNDRDVYISKDEGKSYELFIENIPQPPYRDYYFNKDMHHFLKDFNGRFYRGVPDALGSISSVEYKTESPSTFYTYRPYPNPANNLVTLPFDFMSSLNLANMDIKLIDVSGRDVSQFVDFNIRALNHYKAELEIKLDNIQRGIYFIQMTLNGTNKTSSFIKLN